MCSNGRDEEGELLLRVGIECEEGCPKRRPYNRQSLPWGFLFYRSPEKCVWADRSVCLENSGTLTETACATMKQIRSSSVPCTGFMIYRSGVPSQAMELEEMGVDEQVRTEPRGSNDDKIFFMKYPYPFLQYWYGSFPLTRRRQHPPTRQLFLPHLLMWSQTCQGKAFREMLGSHTCPQARLLS